MARNHLWLLGVGLAFLLSPPPQTMVLRVSSTPDEVGASVGQLIFDLSKQAIATHGRFTVALSGGSLPKVRAKRDDLLPGCRFSMLCCAVL
jgi:hypothetical protein